MSQTEWGGSTFQAKGTRVCGGFGTKPLAPKGAEKSAWLKHGEVGGAWALSQAGGLQALIWNKSFLS